MPRHHNKAEMLADMERRADRQRRPMLASKINITEHAALRLWERFSVSRDNALSAVQESIGACWGVRNLSHTTTGFVDGEWHVYAMTWINDLPATLTIYVADRGAKSTLLTAMVGPPESMTDLRLSDWPEAP